MYDDALEIIEKIKAEKVSEDERGMDIEIKSYLSAGEIVQLCEELSRLSTPDEDGFRFWWETLSVMDKCKIYFFLNSCSKSGQVDNLIRTACALTLELVLQTYKLPCGIELTRDESSYFDAIDKHLDFYLPVEDFEKAHEEAHEVIEVITSGYPAGGWVRKLHTN